MPCLTSLLVAFAMFRLVFLNLRKLKSPLRKKKSLICIKLFTPFSLFRSFPILWGRNCFQNIILKSLSIYTLFATSEKKLCEKISRKLFLQLSLTMSILTIQVSQGNLVEFNFTFKIHRWIPRNSYVLQTVFQIIRILGYSEKKVTYFFQVFHILKLIA